MHTMLILTPDATEWRHVEGDEITLDALRAGVGGGWIDLVRLVDPTEDKPGLDLYVDDEGLLKQQPFNPKATTLVLYYTNQVLTLVGDAVVCASKRDGSNVGLTQEQVDSLVRLLRIGDTNEVPA